MSDQSDHTEQDTTERKPFDIAAWVSGNKYPTKTTEIFLPTQEYMEIADLQESIVNLEKSQRESRRQLSVTDEDALDNANAVLQQLLDNIKGTGITLMVRGRPKRELKIIEDKLARALKPRAAVTDDDGIVVERAVDGGRNHPEFPGKLERAVIEKSVIEVHVGGELVATSIPESMLDSIYNDFGPEERNRLASVTASVNYPRPDLDDEVTVDFS